MSTKLDRIVPRNENEVIKMLVRDYGWTLDQGKGSHVVLRKTGVTQNISWKHEREISVGVRRQIAKIIDPAYFEKNAETIEDEDNTQDYVVDGNKVIFSASFVPAGFSEMVLEMGFWFEKANEFVGSIEDFLMIVEFCNSNN